MQDSTEFADFAAALLQQTNQSQKSSATNSKVSCTIYVADLPRTTSYLDLYECFEKGIGPCDIIIKRPLFKNFYFAFVIFKEEKHGNLYLTYLLLKYSQVSND